MPPSKAALWKAAVPSARRVLELQDTPECVIDTVVDGLERTVWDDASFKQVEDGVAKMPADADEVVLRCMVHAVNTSESLQAAEVAVIMRASELVFASASAMPK